MADCAGEFSGGVIKVYLGLQKSPGSASESEGSNLEEATYNS
jgi:hypothetical protein